MKNLIRNHTALFPEIVDTCRDNNTFAKRIIGPSGDLSPVGPKNISLVLANKLHLPSLLVDLKEKGVSIDYFFADKLLTI
jgi:hypothetical protein